MENLVQSAIFVLNVALLTSIFASWALNYILSMVTSLTLLLHMCLVSLNYPTNVNNFFSTLFPLVTFDLIPTTNLYEAMFRFS